MFVIRYKIPNRLQNHVSGKILQCKFNPVLFTRYMTLTYHTQCFDNYKNRAL